MGASASLQELSRILEQCESGGGVVRSVRADDGPGLFVDDVLRAVVELAVPLERFIGSADDVSLTPASSGDGSLEVEFTGRLPLVPESELDADVSVTREGTDVDGDTVITTLVVSIPTDLTDQERRERIVEPTDADATDTEDLAGESTSVDAGEESSEPDQAADDDPEIEFPRNEDVPPYEDTEYLQAVYDHCGTFEAMTDIIDLDVTAETVRRYMIDAGVHEPTSYQTSSGNADETGLPEESDASETDSNDDEDAMSDLEASADGTILSVDEEATVSMLDADEQGPGHTDEFDDMRGEDGRIVLADGVGLPEGVTVEQVIDSIQQSRTLFEVQQGMGIERDKARSLLQELNLLDIVVGRLAVESERQVTREEIVDRIRDSVSH
ncbi:hypothetical protein VB773_05745 [Haloarculaceae archaeon H-GB2-1]|nr:hypothetical protein [Haloarculaceae archaeon H-GB1-1]MEA5407130.1 hypothetical protein [Haloarculaceae archaeon H-GB2-1]